MATVLVVDDEAPVLFTLTEVVRESGHEPIAARSGAEALEKLEGADVVVSDLSMPGMTGLELLAAVRERDATLPFVLITARGSEKIAVQAIKAGAYDYLTKPFDIETVAMVVDRALETRRLRADNLRMSVERSIGRRIVGSGAKMQRLLRDVTRVAPRDVTVLVRGETGSGKELVASMLHAQSRRAAQPIVRFNCAALPPDLAEAELFGHTRGAFTGAVQARRGFFAQADGGTLVLDEVGELPVGIQAKLLRVLQEGEIQPVGAGRVEKVDVRIVASTNRDLAAEVKRGAFREDLYYRLAVVEFVVPSLRERREDIPELARELGRRYAAKFDIDGLELSPRLVERLASCEWPGNVRQLENTIARLAALSDGGMLDVDALPENLGAAAAPVAADTEEVPPDDGAPSLKEQVEAFERNVIARMLAATGHNQSEAARRLGTSRVTILDKIKRYRLEGKR